MDFEPDILGPDFEAATLPMGEDDEGEVVATLVRRRGPEPGGRAVLYVHGYSDYFFQRHLADFFAARGYRFYALDLRKYGRSLRPHQTHGFCRSVTEYYPEIDEAVRIIRMADGNETLLLAGHSTGGLTVSLWADRVRGRGLIHGLFLNSPFLELNLPGAVVRALRPVVHSIAARTPYRANPGRGAGMWGRSIHRDHWGEWEFDLRWKPLEGIPLRAGWLAAVDRAQRRVHAGLSIDVPVLLMSSTRTVRTRVYRDDLMRGDCVLDAEAIARRGPALGPHVTVVRIEDGLHDLVLSPAAARTRVFDELGRWLRAYLDGPGTAGEPRTAGAPSIGARPF